MIYIIIGLLIFMVFGFYWTLSDEDKELLKNKIKKTK